MREAANFGIMVKSGKFFEDYADAVTIIFDKTGTLTSACPTVSQIIPFGEYTEKQILKIAACLEEHFPHIVARAIVKKSRR